MFVKFMRLICIQNFAPLLVRGHLYGVMQVRMRVRLDVREASMRHFPDEITGIQETIRCRLGQKDVRACKGRYSVFQ